MLILAKLLLDGLLCVVPLYLYFLLLNLPYNKYIAAQQNKVLQLMFVLYCDTTLKKKKHLQSITFTVV